MNVLELFAGAGGGILGSMLNGHRTVCAVEYNAYARSVLLARQNDGTFPPFPVWDDVRTFDGKPWSGRVDVVSGGFPCQAFSTASRGRNNAENLWPEMLRIVADVKPRFVRAENVSREAIETASYDLRSMGYKTKAISLSAADLGAGHVRQRYWLLAYTDDHGELCCSINAEAPELPFIRQGIWEAYPDEHGVANGVANRTHRFKAIGNGQVPIVAATAWNILINQERG